MSVGRSLRVRRDVKELQDEYDRGNKKPLEDLWRAFRAIKELPAEHPQSFFTLGGYHGEPFRGAGWGTSSYWGGYCNHGNVLFPTWHRAYLVALEDALRSVPGCEDVTLPFWDECSEDTLNNGIPWCLTKKDVELDGHTIPNPLRSFVFTRGIVDNINGDDPNYSKPKGYETVRYPLSGLVGTDADRKATAEHNASFPDPAKNVEILNRNVKDWLTSHIVVNGQTIDTHVAQKYRRCLDAPNYTVFSNTTSAQEWNQHLEDGAAQVVPLESPHNSMHLAVGGCEVPGYDRSPIDGANGDMGENDTAGLDPIFFFHHCFVDRVFWLWQKKHGQTDKLDVIAEYPGTNSVDSQGPTPGVVPNSWLDLSSPLDPFKKTEHDGTTRPYTSRDCLDIETQLGYTYGPGSLDQPVERAAPARGHSTKMVRVSGINRAPIRGSFLVSVFAEVDGKRHHLGSEAVLSRWNVQYCANCQTHLEVKAFVPLHDLQEDVVKRASFDVEIRTRDGVLTESQTPPTVKAPVRAMLAKGHRLFKVEVR